MSQNKILIANWKMNLTIKESVKLAKEIKNVKTPKLVICPSFPALAAVRQVLKGSSIKLGAQNCATLEKGALTGEVSAQMLKELGCQYVILGHSERKKYFGESYQQIKQKLKVALSAGLIPIVCLGEEWEDRKCGRAEAVVRKQLRGLLAGLKNLQSQRIILTYEPFWSISTSGGRIAMPKEVLKSVEVMQATLISLYGRKSWRKNLQIIYGGTVNANSVKDFLKLDKIEGFLVGAATSKINSFRKLVKQF